jgi:hypothetical protein
MQLACDSVTIHSVKNITRLWTQMLTFSDCLFLAFFLDNQAYVETAERYSVSAVRATLNRTALRPAGQFV